jgi:hypothetical protein
MNYWNAMQFNTIQYNTIKYNIIQYNTIQKRYVRARCIGPCQDFTNGGHFLFNELKLKAKLNVSFAARKHHQWRGSQGIEPRTYGMRVKCVNRYTLLRQSLDMRSIVEGNYNIIIKVRFRCSAAHVHIVQIMDVIYSRSYHAYSQAYIVTLLISNTEIPTHLSLPRTWLMMSTPSIKPIILWLCRLSHPLIWCS